MSRVLCTPVLRTALVLALPLFLAACGDKDDSGGSLDTDSACGQYMTAFRSCVEQFGGSPSDYGISDAYCDSYPDGHALDAAFECYAGILESADCSTVEGYGEASGQMASDCG